MDNDDFNEPIEHEAEFFSIMEVGKTVLSNSPGGAYMYHLIPISHNNLGMDVQTMYHVILPCSRKISRKKTFHELAENMIFAEKTFANCSLVSLPKDPTPLNFAKKT